MCKQGEREGIAFSRRMCLKNNIVCSMRVSYTHFSECRFSWKGFGAAMLVTRGPSVVAHRSKPVCTYIVCIILYIYI